MKKMKMNKELKRLLLVIGVMLLTSQVSLGQTTSKEINAIKRNPLYIYAEATMESEAEARQVADELLMEQMRGYIESKRKLSDADNVLIKDMLEKSEMLSMMRGTMVRVFLYVKKGDIYVAEEENNLHPVWEPENEMPNPVPAWQVPLATTDNGTSVVESPLKGWQQQAVDTLLKCRDVNAVRACLNRMKMEYKVKRYGTVANCAAPSEAFWAFFDDDGHLVTILGPGTEDRIDFRTMQLSTTDAYKDMNALWFNLAK